ncbi:hypothetical protein ATANTOWER_026343 [Ataeniobius toweri]|uniref:Uncharacterized protein n=1 Tax=Ataeniobius toweri TaxID=208326 RepID=A0ABU7AJ40_9TELE|nr:hypothetical protein [Ataeniobius toweri]
MKTGVRAAALISPPKAGTPSPSSAPSMGVQMSSTYHILMAFNYLLDEKQCIYTIRLGEVHQSLLQQKTHMT